MARDPQFVLPHRLFADLDDRSVQVSGRVWHTEVHSVLDHEGGRWIQLALNGEAQVLVTLRLSIGAGIGSAIAALSLCLSGAKDIATSLNIA